MLRFDILTIFPEVVEPYARASILGRAQRKRLVAIRAHDLRRWTDDRHRSVDDKPYGGGPGMVMRVEPIFRAVKAIRKRKRARVLLMSASGKLFTERVAERYARSYEQLILICGRYEGVDARVAKHIADEEISVGPYVLTGGELPALTIVDAVTRLVPGVIKPESLREETHTLEPPLAATLPTLRRQSSVREASIGEYPQYTRPEVFYPNPRNKRIAWRVPKVLLSGDHRKIAAWRSAHLRRLSPAASRR